MGFCQFHLSFRACFSARGAVQAIRRVNRSAFEISGNIDGDNASVAAHRDHNQQSDSEGAGGDHECHSGIVDPAYIKIGSFFREWISL
jgi:hypothetical protein